MRCRHLLVKHCDSRRPSSWKEANITRTKAEAVQIVEGAFSTYQTVLHLKPNCRTAIDVAPSVGLAWLTMTRPCMHLSALPLARAEFRSQIADGGITFEELASTESDCSSYKRGGDLGPFGRGKMQKEFEAAAYVACFFFHCDAFLQTAFSNWQSETLNSPSVFCCSRLTRHASFISGRLSITRFFASDLRLPLAKCRAS